MENININCLLQDELEYELRIRGCVTARKVVDQRKILHRLLKKTEDPHNLVDPNYDFDSEKIKITELLDSIEELINDFEGPPSDSLFKRIQSRLIHTNFRIHRIQVEDKPEKLLFKNESRATCLLYESQLDSKVKIEDDLNSTQISVHNPLNTTIYPVSVPAKKSYPIYKWGIKFDGNNNSVHNFIETIELLAESRNVSQADLFTSSIELFSGPAALWHKSIKPNLNSWDELKENLKKDFLPINYKDRLWEEIRNRKQDPSEPVLSYVASMQALFKRLDSNIQEKTILKYIRKNILPLYADKFVLIDIVSIANLISLCRKIDEDIALRSTVKSNKCLEPDLAFIAKDLSKCDNQGGTRFNKSKSNSDVKSKKNSLNKESTCSNISTLVCWNCKGSNHSFQHCTAKKNQFCFRCGTPNFTVKTCKTCNNISASKNE